MANTFSNTTRAADTGTGLFTARSYSARNALPVAGAITLDNQPGRAADAITIFSEAKIGITYLYSFLLGNKGILIFRTDNPDRAREVIILNNLSFVAEKDLSTLI